MLVVFYGDPGLGRVRAVARVCQRPRRRPKAATCAAPSTAWSSGILLQPLATISIARWKIDAAALSSASGLRQGLFSADCDEFEPDTASAKQRLRLPQRCAPDGWVAVAGTSPKDLQTCTTPAASSQPS